jgi:hypothetical protein
LGDHDVFYHPTNCHPLRAKREGETTGGRNIRKIKSNKINNKKIAPVLKLSLNAIFLFREGYPIWVCFPINFYSLRPKSEDETIGGR